MIQHPFPPLYNQHSKILILGSFPSVKSRERQFPYGHPQNRFWRVMANIFNSDIPPTIEGKKNFLLSNHVALWDVIASCEIEGSADSTIKDVTPNDISQILRDAEIREIFVNGKTAEKYFNRYTKPLIGRSAVCLPSTSPANATWTLDRLIEAWRVIKEI